MPKPKNAMEIFRLLDKSNCQECGRKTCLAFAGAVFMSQKRLDECPKLDKATIERFCGKDENQNTIEQNRDEYLEKLKTISLILILIKQPKVLGHDSRTTS